jgi:hypothetical protein
MAKKNPVTVETEEQKRNREIVEQIAGNVAALAKAVTALLNGSLKRNAIIILLASSSKLPQWQVEAVLKALESMEKDWLNGK